MGSHKVTNVASPTDNADAVNKEYVDGKVDSVIEKVDGLDGNYLRLDGTNSPTADIDWEGYAINNASIITSISDCKLELIPPKEHTVEDGHLSLLTLDGTSKRAETYIEPNLIRFGWYSSSATLSYESTGGRSYFEIDATNVEYGSKFTVSSSQYSAVNKAYVDSLAPAAMTDTEVSEITALFA